MLHRADVKVNLRELTIGPRNPEAKALWKYHWKDWASRDDAKPLKDDEACYSGSRSERQRVAFSPKHEMLE